MPIYARIQDGSVMETISLAEEQDIAKMFHPDLTWAPCDSNVKQGWTAVQSGGQWTFAAPVAPVPTAEQLWAAYQQQALALLIKSDLVSIRCHKAGIAFPADWLAYVQALRAIVQASSGDPTKPLPAQPAYPAGS